MRSSSDSFCAECGYLFPEAGDAGSAEVPTQPQAGEDVGGRYQIGEFLGKRGTLLRFRGRDLGNDRSNSIPVMILRQPVVNAVQTDARRNKDAECDLFDLPLSSSLDYVDPGTAITVIESAPMWPSLGWERLLLARLNHLSLPRVLDTLVSEGFEFLIIEIPEGRSFWDAWDEMPVSWPGARLRMAGPDRRSAESLARIRRHARRHPSRHHLHLGDRTGHDLRPD